MFALWYLSDAFNFS